MRRISAKSARTGMVLSRPVYDSRGGELFFCGWQLREDDLQTLVIHGVSELLIEDPRVADVPVQPLAPPEVEAEAVMAMRQLLTESRGAATLDERLIVQVERPINTMAKGLFPDVLGEVNATGCPVPGDAGYQHPPRVATLAMLMGRRQGLDRSKLVRLGLAAALMNVGYLYLPAELPKKGTALTAAEEQTFRKHPLISYQLLATNPVVAPETLDAILKHHERWDGTGFPYGLKGEAIPLFARVIAVADAYYELVSKKKGRGAYQPAEAIEFIMAYSGEHFDPTIVETFSRQVPLYPTGVTVKLSTGEVGIVSNANVGHIGRPVVRICKDASGFTVAEPFDLDMSEPEHQARIVAQVMDY